jgi:hypothetical protein
MEAYRTRLIFIRYTPDVRREAEGVSDHSSEDESYASRKREKVNQTYIASTKLASATLPSAPLRHTLGPLTGSHAHTPSLF